ncbi:hypothetical protein HD554DRAFT_2004574, partial [Boletus coccyginus]
MFAPIGECWTLAKVCWWGGWCDTLIHYLLDELYTYENEYSDALALIKQEAHQSLVGEA